MPSLSLKYLALGLLCIAIIVTVFFVSRPQKKENSTPQDLVITSPVVAPAPKPVIRLIGHSVEERAIEAYTFGTGTTHILFVGGIHGGYEWNSVLLAYEVIDYLTSHPESIPHNLTVDILPSVNPDAVFKVTRKEGRFTISDVAKDQKTLTSARFNAHNVDLNRNFDCMWQPKSTWQSKTVSAGNSPFSEPETIAVKDFIRKHNPAAVVFWHSKSNGVYASKCTTGILDETLTLMNTYSLASGYPAIKTFDAYKVTGAAEDWLASIGIPAITVELSSHETVEFQENIAGLKAVLSQYAR
jgi:predicted deacylase